MNTKLTSTWQATTQDIARLGLSSNQEEMQDTLIKRDISLFLNAQNAENLNSPLLKLLNNTFSLVKKEFQANRWVSLCNHIYLDKLAKGFWIIYPYEKQFNIYSTNAELKLIKNAINQKANDPINMWTIPNKAQLKHLTGICKAPFNVARGRPSTTGCYILHQAGSTVLAVDCDQDCGMGRSNEGRAVPFLPMTKTMTSEKQWFIEILKKGFIPSSLNENISYKILLSIFHRKRDGIFKDNISSAQQDLNDLVGQKYINSLLLEDKIRADIAPYHKKMLEDTQLGHWSLWQDELESNDREPLTLPYALVARDPKSSINDGVVGIDFGTKSTVVVYQKDNVNIHPMRIGTGDLSKEVAAFHYENPTIMEFNNLDRFISDYQGKANKPYTRWQDLTISHTAQNSMLGSEASQFNTFLDEIKQWAGDKNRKLKIVSKEGTILDLPPFLELADDDFNPIEVYAYYLGLYINNQNNGIYLDYILSFPVTYEMPIRDKIIQSFERGLRKSLPAELGLETIAQLSVKKGASEPAAYALVALQAYGFEPCEDERIFYSVFDFGGGTTDFDFGIYRAASGRKERRFDYVIEHFGAGGDRFLGGENLLELLAFDVFKKNKSALLAKGIQFEKHPEKDAFAGSEQLLSHSQEAKINTKTLCEKLRPYWEENGDIPLALSSGSIEVNLTDIHGVVHAAFELDIHEDELNVWLSARIEQGIENFFNALRLAFTHSTQPLGDIDSVKIFLAGNSSRSHFVKTLFDKHITKHHEEMGLMAEQASRFDLFAPLGVDKKDVEKPTGKTGVAFGLIEAREGGSILVVDHNLSDEDIGFKFYLGENRRGHFKPVIDREVTFHQWIEFIDAEYEKFEIFYTDQANSSTGNVPTSDSSIKKRVVKLDVTDESALVYLRVVSPTSIEYVVANEDDISDELYLSNIYRIDF
ncbi:molecular chaperone DnaK [Photobacterium nomapromontoriensis]|uniref:molecular chaperone DnaK n=1 Tax=Photobacterium nomapromontoriensis TaxID=2910237 RepID=UPI003D0AE2B8